MIYHPKYRKSNTAKCGLYRVKSSKLMMHKIFLEHPASENLPKICDIKFTKENLLKIIKKLKMNGSPGPDGVTPLLLKIFCEELSTPLLILFENSFQSGIFSDLWKLAYICPLKKPGK